MSRLVAVAAIFFAAFMLLPISGGFEPSEAVAQTSRSGLPVPRFESLAHSEVNMRQGPSRNHRILWEFRDQRGLPVEIVTETENWRQIRDPDGDLGWVHQSQLNQSRGVVVAGGMRPLRRRASSDAATVAYLEARVVAELDECTEDWCRISVQGYSGWIRHDEVWGVYPREVVN